MQGLLLITACLIPGLLFAQEKEGNEEAEQIFITKKGNIHEKIKIEIDVDKIMINGKPVLESDKDSVTVKRVKIKDLHSFKDADIKGRGMVTILGSAPERPKANKAMLGVTTEKAEAGLGIKNIREESAAEKAGLKPNDIITAIDHKKLIEPDDLFVALKDKNPGDKVNIEYVRGGKKSSAVAKLTPWKAATSLPSVTGDDVCIMPRIDIDELIRQMPQKEYRGNGDWSFVYPSRPAGSKLGIKIQDQETGTGVKILEVQKGSDADKAGIREGDILKEANGKQINSTEDMATQIRSAPSGGVLKLKIERNGHSQSIDVQVRKKMKTANL